MTTHSPVLDINKQELPVVFQQRVSSGRSFPLPPHGFSFPAGNSRDHLAFLLRDAFLTVRLTARQRVFMFFPSAPRMNSVSFP